jgi:hypothetical protein
MKLAALALALLASVAHATCQDVYDPINGRWVYVCAQNPQNPPVCHNEYDPINRVWVLVCQ